MIPGKKIGIILLVNRHKPCSPFLSMMAYTIIDHLLNLPEIDWAERLHAYDGVFGGTHYNWKVDLMPGEPVEHTELSHKLEEYTGMYENPVTQDNLKLLEKYGMEVITPANGWLACGDVGAGKMPEPEDLFEYILKCIACKKDLRGKKVLVTAGPTQEAIDPVRYITNHSSGKMGYSLAKACMLRGADVTLVTGKTALTPPPFITTVPVISAKDMYEEVTARSTGMDMIFKAAAVADYRPVHIADEKIKKSDSSASIDLERTDDILKYLGEHKTPGQFLCGFSMETENMLENSRKKLAKKNLDMVVANNLKVAGAGFETDTNVVTLITDTEVLELPIMNKEEVAFHIIDQILSMQNTDR